MKGSETISNDTDLPGLDFVEGSTKDVRTRVLAALHDGTDMDIVLASGHRLTAPINDARRRENGRELQAKIIGNTFIAILRIPYDDALPVSAEIYDLS